MVHLDRENGAILLPDGSVVPYDVLVLCTGLQVREGSREGLTRAGPAGARGGEADRLSERNVCGTFAERVRNMLFVRPVPLR